MQPPPPHNLTKFKQRNMPIYSKLSLKKNIKTVHNLINSSVVSQIKWGGGKLNPPSELWLREKNDKNIY